MLEESIALLSERAHHEESDMLEKLKELCINSNILKNDAILSKKIINERLNEAGKVFRGTKINNHVNSVLKKENYKSVGTMIYGIDSLLEFCENKNKPELHKHKKLQDETKSLSICQAIGYKPEKIKKPRAYEQRDSKNK